jgi:hypothetical protein
VFSSIFFLIENEIRFHWMDDFSENETRFHWMDEQVRVLTLTLTTTSTSIYLFLGVFTLKMHVRFVGERLTLDTDTGCHP